MIKNVMSDNIIQVYKMDTYGGVDLSVTMTPLYADLLNWLSKFKYEHEQELKIREESPAVKNAWEQYQVIKTLATKEKADVI
jgi:hypothetical protein